MTHTCFGTEYVDWSGGILVTATDFAALEDDRRRTGNAFVERVGSYGRRIAPENIVIRAADKTGMTLEQVAMQFAELPENPCPVLRAMLRASLDAVRPPIPFDPEPPYDVPAVTITQTRHDHEMREQYDHVRLWHRLDEQLRGLKHLPG